MVPAGQAGVHAGQLEVQVLPGHKQDAARCLELANKALLINSAWNIILLLSYLLIASCLLPLCFLFKSSANILSTLPPLDLGLPESFCTRNINIIFGFNLRKHYTFFYWFYGESQSTLIQIFFAKYS